jgi:hypothetical protein
MFDAMPTMDAFVRNLDYQSLVQHVTARNLVSSAVGIVVLAEVLVVLYNLFINPLRDIPGPLLARFTRLWEFKQALAGTMAETLIELHQKHG